MLLPERELTLPFSVSFEGQGSLSPLLIQHSFSVVYSAPGPVLGAEDREDSKS